MVQPFSSPVSAWQKGQTNKISIRQQRCSAPFDVHFVPQHLVFWLNRFQVLVHNATRTTKLSYPGGLLQCASLWSLPGMGLHLPFVSQLKRKP